VGDSVRRGSLESGSTGNAGFVSIGGSQGNGFRFEGKPWFGFGFGLRFEFVFVFVLMPLSAVA
jgi:hypothetical protein